MTNPVKQLKHLIGPQIVSTVQRRAAMALMAAGVVVAATAAAPAHAFGGMVGSGTGSDGTSGAEWCRTALTLAGGVGGRNVAKDHSAASQVGAAVGGMITGAVIAGFTCPKVPGERVQLPTQPQPQALPPGYGQGGFGGYANGYSAPAQHVVPMSTIERDLVQQRMAQMEDARAAWARELARRDAGASSNDAVNEARQRFGQQVMESQRLLTQLMGGDGSAPRQVAGHLEIVNAYTRLAVAPEITNASALTAYQAASGLSNLNRQTARSPSMERRGPTP